MATYITDEDGSPHARSTGITISNAARSAFVELITRHDLEGITIHGVEDNGTYDGPVHNIEIKYSDESGQKTLAADAIPLNQQGERAEEGEDTARWRVNLVDHFRQK